VAPSVSPVVNTTVSVGGAWVHDKPGVSSRVCTMIMTSPPLPGAKVATTVSTTNGVISGPTMASGTTDASGASEAKFTITQFGSYSFAATVTAPSGATSSATGSVTVTSAAGTGCP
jgi:hypothetical protein